MGWVSAANLGAAAAGGGAAAPARLPPPAAAAAAGGVAPLDPQQLLRQVEEVGPSHALVQGLTAVAAEQLLQLLLADLAKGKLATLLVQLVTKPEVLEGLVQEGQRKMEEGTGSILGAWWAQQQQEEEDHRVREQQQQQLLEERLHWQQRQQQQEEEREVSPSDDELVPVDHPADGKS